MKTKFTLLIVMLGFFISSRSQQQILNGGLETWTSISTPTDWTTLEDIIPPIAGVGLSVKDSTDKVEGNSSIKLISQYVALADDTVGGVLAVGTGAFTGGSPQTFGTPFTSKPDTLTFSYKYVPVGADTASVEIKLHKTGGGNNYILNKRFSLTATSGMWVDTFLVLTGWYSDHISSNDTLLLEFTSSILGGGGSSIKSRVGTALNIDAIGLGYALPPVTHLNAYTLGNDPLGSHNFNLYGTINSHNDAASYSFVYSTDSTFATSTSTPAQTKTNNKYDVVWATVNGLTANTTYFYYVTATTTTDTSVGAYMRFYTDTISYSFQNLGADVYGNSYAEMHGRLNAFPNTAALSFEYGPNPGAMDSIGISDLPSVSDQNTHYFRASLTTLPPNGMYFFRIKAISATDTVYSDIKAFDLSNPYTMLQAMPASNISTSSATLNANVQGFQVPIKINSEIDGPGVSHLHTILDYHDVTGAIIAFTYNATGLQASSHYSVRIKVESFVGNFYGDTAFSTVINTIEKTEDNNTLVISPNPAINYLNLELEKDQNSEKRIQLFALNGQLMVEHRMAANESKTVLNITDLDAGFYLLRFVSGKTVYTDKICVIK